MESQVLKSHRQLILRPAQPGLAQRSPEFPNLLIFLKDKLEIKIQGNSSDL